MKITRKDLNNVEKDVMHACDNISDARIYRRNGGQQ